MAPPSGCIATISDKINVLESCEGVLECRLPPPPAISKTDPEFLALGLEFVYTRDGIKVTELNELFEKVSAQSRHH
jgi:hypothetical protein